jgi:predicted alpha/beta hydrolase family esterase
MHRHARQAAGPQDRGLSTLLLVPGLRDRTDKHWQPLLGMKLMWSRPVRSVPPAGRENIDLAARVAAIQDALESIQGEVTIVAHSAGVLMLAHWAQQYRRANIVGALLAAPADLETPMPEGYPTLAALQRNGWLPVPRKRLPFPSIVAASSNDPLASLTRVEKLARDWGSELVQLGDVGHLNPASGFGEWPMAEELVARLDRS